MFPTEFYSDRFSIESRDLISTWREQIDWSRLRQGTRSPNMNARALDLREVASQISAIWVQMQQQFRTLPFGAKLIFSVAIGGLMLRALGVGFDTSTLILIALALSPWGGVIIEKMKFGEFEVNLKERQEQQQSQIDTA